MVALSVDAALGGASVRWRVLVVHAAAYVAGDLALALAFDRLPPSRALWLAALVAIVAATAALPFAYSWRLVLDERRRATVGAE